MPENGLLRIFSLLLMSSLGLLTAMYALARLGAGKASQMALLLGQAGLIAALVVLVLALLALLGGSLWQGVKSYFAPPARMLRSRRSIQYRTRSLQARYHQRRAALIREAMARRRKLDECNTRQQLQAFSQGLRSHLRQRRTELEPALRRRINRSVKRAVQQLDTPYLLRLDTALREHSGDRLVVALQDFWEAPMETELDRPGQKG